jgi:hypothetical protein
MCTKYHTYFFFLRKNSITHRYTRITIYTNSYSIYLRQEICYQEYAVYQKEIFYLNKIRQSKSRLRFLMGRSSCRTASGWKGLVYSAHIEQPWPAHTANVAFKKEMWPAKLGQAERVKSPSILGRAHAS